MEYNKWMIMIESICLSRKRIGLCQVDGTSPRIYAILLLCLECPPLLPSRRQLGKDGAIEYSNDIVLFHVPILRP